MGEPASGNDNEPRARRALPKLAQKARKVENIALGGEQAMRPCDATPSEPESAARRAANSARLKPLRRHL